MFCRISLRSSVLLWLLIPICCRAAPPSSAPPSSDQNRDAQSRGDQLVADYFRAETLAIGEHCLSDIAALEDWTERRESYRSQLLEMLGLDPLPDRTPLNAVITGTVSHEELIVERIHFQSMPGLYVTANLYRPVTQTERLPAILYVCGHGGVKKDGVSLGNKTLYQHHGAWFARHGYVCLTIDTIQLGEIEGIHHGTYREGMWWWNSRGYTPAGVEAWNCVRALDYLQSREEVDGERLGMTGRSGGGAYTWWTAAIDERIKVAVPVAGITNLKNHVIDGCVEGHCDCMFMVNTYRWDYPMVAALVAPRPLLISNTDKDPIFPLDGVIDVHAKVRRIYELYGAGDNLGLQITEGPHKDTQELQVHAFRWFNRFLRQSDELLWSPATPYFEQEQLKVLESIPEDQRVTTIHETFVPAVSADASPTNREELNAQGRQWITSLREKTFRGWPEFDGPAVGKLTREAEGDGLTLRVMEFVSQEPFALEIFLLDRDSPSTHRRVVRVLRQSDWESLLPAMAFLFPTEFAGTPPDEEMGTILRSSLDEGSLALVMPRGIGPTQWSGDEKRLVQIRRRFMLLGQSLAGMQVFDVARALQVLQTTSGLKDEVLELSATGEAAVWTMYASLFASPVRSIYLDSLPATHRDAPDLLNVSRIVELSQIALLAASQVDSFRITDGDGLRRQFWQTLQQENSLTGELIEVSPPLTGD